MPYKPRKLGPIKEHLAPKPERPSTTARGYGTTHRKLRDELLALHPVCQRCRSRLAHHAHHLRYPAESLSDYAALCHDCHRQIHAEEL